MICIRYLKFYHIILLCTCQWEKKVGKSFDIVWWVINFKIQLECKWKYYPSIHIYYTVFYVPIKVCTLYLPMSGTVIIINFNVYLLKQDTSRLKSENLEIFIHTYYACILIKHIFKIIIN